MMLVLRLEKTEKGRNREEKDFIRDDVRNVSEVGKSHFAKRATRSTFNPIDISKDVFQTLDEDFT